MKKIIKIGIVMTFFLSCNYYINQFVEGLRKQDTIMQEIEKSKEKYEIEPVNAEITNNTIIPGITGVKIDTDKSYHNMKQYGSYNEAMTVLKEINPEITVNNYYDKYIEEGNKNKRQVAFLIVVNQNLERVISLLEKNNIKGTIFLDGQDLETSSRAISKANNHEYEILSYQKEYSPSFLKTSISYLESITRKKGKYCYTEEENQNLLDFCKKEKLHTIKKESIKEKLYQEVKKTLKSGQIYAIELNEETEKEFSTTIRYMKQKGYEFVTLNELLKE